MIRSKYQYEILLPTFNGSLFLHELLESCICQQNVFLSIRDDGSTDCTLDILHDYAEKFTNQIHIASGKNIGIRENVSWLLEHMHCPYFLLADQDDIWEKNKVHRLAEAMHGLEMTYGKDMPLLVYSDMSLIDSMGRQLAPSFFAASGIPSDWCEEFRHSLIMSNAAGCSMLGNRALAELAVPVPKNCYMHDWWLLLTAQAFGHVRVVDEPLVRYRQHGGNLLGAGVDKGTLWTKLRKGFSGTLRNIAATQTQAREFFNRYGSLMDEEKKELCRAWASMAEKNVFSRLDACLRHGFAKPGKGRCLALWAALLFDQSAQQEQ